MVIGHALTTQTATLSSIQLPQQLVGGVLAAADHVYRDVFLFDPKKIDLVVPIF
jgi:hypothetical protein